MLQLYYFASYEQVAYPSHWGGRKKVGTMGRAARKERKTFTLSRDSIRYVKEVRREKGAPSESSALEEILTESRQAREMAKIESSISNYYDSISDEERASNRAWGAFAESQQENT